MALGQTISADPDDLVCVPNATFGINIVAHSLDLDPGDEVLTTDYEYGACDKAWRFLQVKRGFAYKQKPISFPAESNEAIIDQFWRGVTSRIKVIFFGHITSSTARTLPVQEICQLARQRGILTVIDGAHAPGQVSIEMEAICADFYFGHAQEYHLA